MMALFFAAERRAYFGRLAFDTGLEVIARDLEELERRVGRRHAGREHARALGLPEALAPLVEVFVYSSAPAARLRAAGLVCRALHREAAVA